MLRCKIQTFFLYKIKRKSDKALHNKDRSNYRLKLLRNFFSVYFAEKRKKAKKIRFWKKHSHRDIEL